MRQSLQSSKTSHQSFSSGFVLQGCLSVLTLVNYNNCHQSYTMCVQLKRENIGGSEDKSERHVRRNPEKSKIQEHMVSGKRE